MKQYNDIIFMVVILLIIILMTVFKKTVEHFPTHSYSEKDLQKKLDHPIRKGHTFGGSSAYNKYSNKINLSNEINNTKFKVLNTFKGSNYTKEIETNKGNNSIISNREVKSQKFSRFPEDNKPPSVKRYSCLEKCINSNVECIELNCNVGSYAQCNNHSNLQNYVCEAKARDNTELNWSEKASMSSNVEQSNKDLIKTCTKKCSN